MQILIPLAAKSTFFNSAEFFFPKPLIEISGKPMIELVILNLKSIPGIKKFIFVVNEDDVKKFSLDKTISHAVGDTAVDVIVSKGETAGSLCSCLLAIDKIDLDKPLVIANGDQIFDLHLDDIFCKFKKDDADTGVVIFDSVHPRWSYVGFDENNKPCQFSEKDVISRNAIAGVYYFKSANSFFDAAFDAIRNELTTNDLYYVAPSLNKFILDNKKIITYKINAEKYHSFYSPQKLKEYEKMPEALSILFGKECGKKPIKIIIPAAGLGSRFAKAGYSLPKPFIDVGGIPMIERVMDNLEIRDRPVQFYVILQSEHVAKYPQFVSKIKQKGGIVIEINGVTEGTVCTVLHVINDINEDSPIIIANSDQLVDFSISDYINDAMMRRLDGSILCFEEPKRDLKWSYAAVDQDGYVTAVKEKIAISSIATVGIYFFNSGKEFVQASVKMVAANDRINNEFYTCPVYNYLISENKKIGCYMVNKESMHGLGIPEDLNLFLKKNVELLEV